MKPRFLPVLSAQTDRRSVLLLGAAGVSAVACGPMPSANDGSVGSETGADARTNEDTFAPTDASASPDSALRDASTPDAAVQDVRADAVPSNCPVNGVPTIAPASLNVGSAELFNRGSPFYLVRDDLGYFALSAVCTHSGCTVDVALGGFHCACHGSEFTLTGAVAIGPARRALAHYPLCLETSSGVLVVDTSRTVAANVRFVP